MTNSVIDAPMGSDSLTIPTRGEWTLLLLLATQGVRDIQMRTPEDAAIDAEDILTQAEEANAIEPIG